MIRKPQEKRRYKSLPLTKLECARFDELERKSKGRPKGPFQSKATFETMLRSTRKTVLIDRTGATDPNRSAVIDAKLAQLRTQPHA